MKASSAGFASERIDEGIQCRLCFRTLSVHVTSRFSSYGSTEEKGNEKGDRERTARRSTSNGDQDTRFIRLKHREENEQDWESKLWNTENDDHEESLEFVYIVKSLPTRICLKDRRRSSRDTSDSIPFREPALQGFKFHTERENMILYFNFIR